MTNATPAPPLLVEGETCWRRTRAGRVALLVDGEAYYDALAKALARAQHTVWMIGWDFHSEVRLQRGEAEGGRPAELRLLLEALVRERRRLRVHVLGWDFAMLYALERQALPLLQFGARTHRRIEFELASDHPVGACHHQKLVVVDDAVAFVGGFDVTSHRWDTRAHLPRDPRRTRPDQRCYGPFHDAQMAVDGEAAACLAALARERWREATGRRVSAPLARGDAWPDDLEPDARDAVVGISRTLAAHAGRREAREIEALHLRAVRSARREIYLETQYLTAHAVTEALCERLSGREGPEVVIVMPREAAGWLEQGTMDALRDRAVKRLRAADAHGRLRIYWPAVAAEEGLEPVYVHAKITVVDDALLRIGSANLSNRSMGLDSECDLVLEAGDDAAVRAAIRTFRNGLLAEHLAAAPGRIAAEIERQGSLGRAVEALRGPGRSLQPLVLSTPEWVGEAVGRLGVADPEHPLPLEEMVERFVREGRPAPSHGASWLRVALVALGVCGLLLAVRYTPLAEWAAPARLAGLVAPLRETAGGIVIATGIFALASVLMVPVTGLVVATSLTLGAGVGLVVSLGGSVVGAAAGYAAGRLFWRDAVRRIAGRRLNDLSRRLGRRGILSTALMRVLPVAPFTVVNLVAGASHLRFRDFLLGTTVGMMPGLAALSFAADGVAAAVRQPGTGTLLWAMAAVVVAVLILAGLRRVALRRGAAAGTPSAAGGEAGSR